MSVADEEHIKAIANAAGRAGAKEMLLFLGVDVSTPAGIQRAQRNFAFLDDLRVGTAALKGKIVTRVVGAVVVALLFWLAIGFRASSGH